MQKVRRISNSTDSELLKWYGLDFTQYVYFENKFKYQWQQKNMIQSVLIDD